MFIFNLLKDRALKWFILNNKHELRDAMEECDFPE